MSEKITTSNTTETDKLKSIIQLNIDTMLN